MALKTYEGQVCDAVVRLLEERTGAKREELWHPEEKKDGDVELAFKLAGQQYVVEHTAIEPFEDFLRLNAQAAKHFEPIEKACTGVTGDVLEVEVPARCMQDLHKADLAKAQAALIVYVQTNAQNLPRRRYGDYIGADKEITIADVPFPFRLFRFENFGTVPRLQFKHIAPDIEKERQARIERACGDKFPKLNAWKKQRAKTILALEDNDIQLTSPGGVAKVFVPIARGRGDAPDETYLIASCMKPWQLWPILLDGKSLSDLSHQGLDKNIPFDEDKLEWITKRRRQ